MHGFSFKKSPDDFHREIGIDTRMKVEHPEWHGVTGIATPPQRASLGVSATVRFIQEGTEYQVIIVAKSREALRAVRKRILQTDNGWDMAIKAPCVVMDQKDVLLEDDL
jgi:hypothetical protein